MKKFYIQMFTTNTDIHKRLDDYLDDKIIHSKLDDTDIYEIIVFDLSKNEISELYDIFQMYEIDITY